MEGCAGSITKGKRDGRKHPKKGVGLSKEGTHGERRLPGMAVMAEIATPADNPLQRSGIRDLGIGNGKIGCAQIFFQEGREKMSPAENSRFLA